MRLWLPLKQQQHCKVTVLPKYYEINIVQHSDSAASFIIQVFLCSLSISTILNFFSMRWNFLQLLHKFTYAINPTIEILQRCDYLHCTAFNSLPERAELN